MNKKKIISNLITVAFLAIFVWYGFTNQDAIQALKAVPIWCLALIAFGKMLVFISNGIFTKLTAELFTKKFSVFAGINITILSAIGNFFGPLLGGTSIRAVYLKKYHNLSYSKFTSTLMGYYLILFISNCVLAILSVLLLPRTRQSGFLLLIFTAWLVALVALTFVKLPQLHKLDFLNRNKFGKYLVKVLYEIEDGWQLLIKNIPLLLKLTGLAVLSLFAAYFIAFVEFKALHIPVNYAALGLYTAVVATSLLLSITPGAIGIRETMLILVASTLGISNAQILQVAIIDRGVHFVLLGILFLITRQSKFRKSIEADVAEG